MTTLADRSRQFIGERIRARRERLGLTQEAVARLIGIAAPSLSNYERGHRPILAEDLPRLARALNTTVAYFFGEDSESDVVREDFARYYAGAPPILQEAAMNVLRAAHQEDDAEETTHGRRAG